MLALLGILAALSASSAHPTAEGMPRASATAPRLGMIATVVASSTALAVSDSADVAQVVAAFHAALAAGDGAAALRLLAPDAIIQESGGVESRADYESHHLSGDIEFARAVPSTRSALRVVTDGNVAWISSTSVTKGTFRTRAINSVGAELMILSRTSGTWRIRAIHWSSRAAKGA